jgi:hypothetical protein
MGALDAAVRAGKALYVGDLLLLARAHREAPPICAGWVRRC